jgi:hypothetical protein
VLRAFKGAPRAFQGAPSFQGGTEGLQGCTEGDEERRTSSSMPSTTSHGVHRGLHQNQNSAHAHTQTHHHTDLQHKQRWDWCDLTFVACTEWPCTSYLVVLAGYLGTGPLALPLALNIASSLKFVGIHRVQPLGPRPRDREIEIVMALTDTGDLFACFAFTTERSKHCRK